MLLSEKINNDLRQALKQKQEIKVSVLRLLNASIQNKKIEKMRKDEDLSDDEILGVINTEVKKRKDAYEAYTKANRLEAAEKEKMELNVLTAYLPPQLSEADLRVIIKETAIKTNAQTEKDFGLLMKEVTLQTKGRADGALIAKLVKEFLNLKS